MWSSPHALSCEGLSRNLSRALEHVESSLRHASTQGCARVSAPDWAPQRLLAYVCGARPQVSLGNGLAGVLQ